MKRIFLGLLISLLLIGKAWCTDYTADANCQGAWLMEENTGTTTKDSSVNALTANFYSFPTWQSTSPPVTSSLHYIHFDTNTNIEISNNAAYNITSKISLITWIKLDNTGSRRLILGKGNFSSVSTGQYWLEVTSLNEPGFYLSDGTNDHRLLGTSTTIADTNWHNICGVYDGTTQKIHVDGVLDLNTATWSASIHTTTLDFAIGRGGELDALYLTGSADDVGIFNRNITLTEINDIMDNGLKGAGAPPTAAPPPQTQVIIW